MKIFSIFIVGWLINLSNCQSEKNLEQFKQFSNLFAQNEHIFKNPTVTFYLHELLTDEEVKVKYYQGDIWLNEQTLIEITDEYVLYQPFASLSDSDSCSSKLERLKELYSDTTPQIRPVMKVKVREKENFGLVCPYCKSLDWNSSNEEFVRWYRMNDLQRVGEDNTAKKKYVSVESMGNDRLIQLQNILHFKEFESVDSGIYFCVTDETFSHNPLGSEIPDQIDRVLSLSDNLFRINFIVMDEHPFDSEPKLIKNQHLNILEYVNLTSIESNSYFHQQSHLNVFTHWREWSLCEFCRPQSFKNRWGECRIMYYPPNNQIPNEYLSILSRAFYNEGWSCYSSVNFKYFAYFDNSQPAPSSNFFKDSIQFADCSIDCIDLEKAKEIRDLESLIDITIIEDIEERLIALPPTKFEIKTNSIKRFRGESVRLFCHYHKFLKKGEQIEWRKNGKVLKDVESSVVGKRRYKNLLNEYEIENLEFKDNGVYGCFLNKKLVSLIDLNVETRMKLQLKRQAFNRKYNKIIPKLFECFTIITSLLVFMIFMNCILNAIKIRKAKSKLNNNNSVTMYSYLKMNTDYFENELLEKLLDNKQISDLK